MSDFTKPNVIERHRKYQPLLSERPKNLMYDDDFYKTELGDHVLFQHIDSENFVSRPIYGVFVGFSVWDMALVFNFVEQFRCAVGNTRVITNAKLGYDASISEFDPEVQTIQFWTDTIHILGSWSTKPSFSDLRTARKRAIT